MPYSQEHMLLQLNGAIGMDPNDPLEQFSFGIRFLNSGATTLGDLDTDAVFEDIVDSVMTQFRRTDTGINDAAKLGSIKWNRIGTDGRYVNDETRVRYVTNTAGNHTPKYYLPPQCSLAVTLRTGKTRGLAHSGRFYLPMPSFTLDPNDFLIPRAQALAVAASWGSWLDGLQVNNLIGAKAVVMSKGRNNGAGAGVTNEVTAVEVGCVIDTMRSRRGKLPENYQRHEFGAV